METTLGKGNNFSIAKAGLIMFFESGDFKEGDTIDYGCLGYSHIIVDIAGAKHIGAWTSPQVIARLASSPFWESKSVRQFYNGIGNGKARMLKPSEKGKDFYNKHFLGKDYYKKIMSEKGQTR